MTYGYDAASRLTSFAEGATSKTITWDADSNRLTYGAQVFTYRADDSIKTATDTNGSNVKTYGYTVAGALTNVLTGEQVQVRDGRIALRDAFRSFPAALLSA